MWTITVQGPRLTAVVDASGSMATIVPVRNRSRMDVTKASLIQALAGSRRTTRSVCGSSPLRSTAPRTTADWCRPPGSATP